MSASPQLKLATPQASRKGRKGKRMGMTRLARKCDPSQKVNVDETNAKVFMAARDKIIQFAQQYEKLEDAINSLRYSEYRQWNLRPVYLTSIATPILKEIWQCIVDYGWYRFILEIRDCEQGCALADDDNDYWDSYDDNETWHIRRNAVIEHQATIAASQAKIDAQFRTYPDDIMSWHCLNGLRENLPTEICHVITSYLSDQLKTPLGLDEYEFRLLSNVHNVNVEGLATIRDFIKRWGYKRLLKFNKTLPPYR